MRCYSKVGDRVGLPAYRTPSSFHKNKIKQSERVQFLVKAVPKSGFSQIEKGKEGGLKIWLKSSPVKNKANQELVHVLSDYFGVSKAKVKIVMGKKAEKNNRATKELKKEKY